MNKFFKDLSTEDKIYLSLYMIFLIGAIILVIAWRDAIFAWHYD